MIKVFTFLFACASLLTLTLAAQTPQGFASATYLNPLPVNNNTADKPQSKVWTYAGKWWTVLSDTEGTHVWRLDGTTWTRILTVSPSNYEKADCKVVGNVVHVLLFRGTHKTYFTSIEYDPASTAYKLWSKRPERITLSLEPETETATLDMDSQGRLWMAYDGSSEVKVQWSDSPYSTWSSPITIASGIKDDDICAVIALPGKIGVLWSDQNAKRFGFKTHTDGAEPTAWSENEVPASQSALDLGIGMADDHLNMVVASDGTLYSAVKTGYDTPGHAMVGLLVRRPSGTWDDLYQVTDEIGTRPIVILNEKLGIVKVFYTDNVKGGNILYKDSPIDNILFCTSYTLFTGVYNYTTSMKDSYTSEIVILATNEGSSIRQVEGVLAKDEPQVITDLPSPCDKDNLLNGLLVYPNPFSKRATISFPLRVKGEYTITIFDSKGAKIADTYHGMGVTDELNKVEIDGSKLSRGFYLIRLETAEGVYSAKIIHEK